MINCSLEQLSKRDETIFSYENQVCNLTILTCKKNLCFAEFSTKFIKIKGWLLLTFFICLHNQLSSFNSITVQMSEKRVHQIDSQNEWLLLSVTFTAKLDLVFVLTVENAFSQSFHFKANRKSIGSSTKLSQGFSKQLTV